MANSLISQVKIGSNTYDLSANNADKLSTARTIKLSKGVTSTGVGFDGTKNVSIPVNGVYETYIEWGGKNRSGSISPVEVACSNLLNANRFAFANPSGITIEYSTDGGQTYLPYSTKDSEKTYLVSGILGAAYGIGGTTDNTTKATPNDLLRITFHGPTMHVYTRICSMLLTVGQADGSNDQGYVIVEGRKFHNSDFQLIKKYNVWGWTNVNSIPVICDFGGNGSQGQTTNIEYLRLTFGIGASQGHRLYVSQIYVIGDTYWSSPSYLARTGHLYDYDWKQNAYFPASIQATSFEGNLSGNAATSSVSSALLAPATLDSQEKIDNFITPSKLQYGIFQTSDNNIGLNSNDGMIISIPWNSTTFGAQIAIDDSTEGILKYRGKDGNGWGLWRTVIHDGNYTNYSPTKDGTGASGTWNINITGNAATATSVQAVDGGSID